MATSPTSKSSTTPGASSGSRATSGPSSGSRGTTSAGSSSRPAASAAGVFSVDMPSTGAANFPPIYEAAILYAADQCDAAELVLKDYLATNTGKNSIRAWLCIFDFYQVTNNRREFDALSMAFTVKFERSSPVWLETAERPGPRRREKRDRKDLFVLSPAKDDAILSEIGRFELFSTQRGSARLDFSRVKNILAEEAELLTSALKRLRKAKIPLWFNSLEAFVVQLRRSINERVGEPLDQTQGFWWILFELYILDGRLQEYEDLGLEYAIAFEISPPAWETVNRPTASEDKTFTDVITERNVAIPIGFPITGVVSQASLDILQQLAVYASGREEVAIDMSGNPLPPQSCEAMP